MDGSFLPESIYFIFFIFHFFLNMVLKRSGVLKDDDKLCVPFFN
jgi:hypothetical protein